MYFCIVMSLSYTLTFHGCIPKHLSYTSACPRFAAGQSIFVLLFILQLRPWFGSKEGVKHRVTLPFYGEMDGFVVLLGEKKYKWEVQWS